MRRGRFEPAPLYDALLAAGSDLGLSHFGARALQSLRLEKSFGTWAREFRPINTPVEAGLDRFIDLAKPDLVGGTAARAAHEARPARRLVTFVVQATDADPIGDEPVWHDGKVVGWITSGGYGHYTGKSIAMGYVPAALAQAESGFEIEILGDRRRLRCARSRSTIRRARECDWDDARALRDRANRALPLPCACGSPNVPIIARSSRRMGLPRSPIA